MSCGALWKQERVLRGGVQDMSGNVWEWCLNEYSNPERTQLEGDEWRVLRGGSWGYDRDDARAILRFNAHPYGRGYFIGLRVVRPPSL